MMVKDEVRRVWMMLLMIGVAVEVYDSAVTYWWVLDENKVQTVKCCKKFYQTWCKKVQLSDQSCVWWWSLELSNGTVYLLVFTTTVKVSISLPVISKLVRPHHL